MKKKNVLILLVVTLLISSMLAGCGADKGTENVKDTVRFMGQIRSDTANVYSSSGMLDRVVKFAIYDTLFKYGENGELIPNLAESWVEDETSITVKLNQDVTFHDGSTMTANDVIYSANTYIEKPENKWIMGYLLSWTKIDEYTVTFTKAAPYVKGMDILAQIIFIIPEAYHSSDRENFETNPIGSGPYKFVSIEDDGSVVLVANENYFKGVPEIQNAIVVPPIDPATAVISLESNEVDVVPNIIPSQVKIVKSNEDVVYQEEASWSMNTLMLLDEDFADDNLRKAIAYSINLENAVLLGNEGQGVPATNIFSKNTMGDFAGQVPYEGYNLKKAKEYLASSNYDMEKTYKIATLSSYAPLAQSIQSDLSAIGINVVIEQMDLKSYIQSIEDGDMEITLTLTGSNLFSFEEALTSMLYPAFGKHLYISSELRDVLEKIVGETDTEVRKELNLRALELIYDYLYMIPIYEHTSNVAHSSSITNISGGSIINNTYYLGDFKLAK